MTRKRRQHIYKKQNGSPTILKKGHAHKSKKDYDRKGVKDKCKRYEAQRRFIDEFNSGYYHDDGDWDSPRDHRPLDFSDGFIYDQVKLFNEDWG